MFSKDKILTLIVGCSITCSYSQITQINSGTSEALNNLSAIDKNIVICSNTNNYLVKSYNECNTLIPLTIPGSIGNTTRLQRLDSNNIFLLSYSASQTLLFKSTNGGNNWTQKSATSGSFGHDFSFFDSLEALMTDGPFLYRTINGGMSWTSVTPPFSVGMSVIKTYGDSLVCLGGLAATTGGLVFSKDRGNTWPYGWGGFGAIEMTAFFFLNKDTIFGVSKGGSFAKTTDGGKNWDGMSEPPIANSYGVYFKNGKEGFVVGNNSQGYGLVVKTTDLGKTWSVFNTNIITSLTNIAVLNDSIAILTGNNGVLLRWNYKSTVFTGLKEDKLTEPNITFFPNPVNKNLHFKSKFISTADFNISNTLGQIVFSKNDFDLQQELDLSFLSSGIYFLDLSAEKERLLVKILKE